MSISNEENTPQREMPRYIGHKTVWALQIRSIEPMDGGRARLSFKEPTYGAYTTEPGWVDRHHAQAGGYMVVYEDGYRSWSPQDAFEKGYTPETLWGVLPTQEPKYMVNAAGRLANRETGIAIPDTEPVVTFRGKDALLPHILLTYRDLLAPGVHRDRVEEQLQRVLAFQDTYSTFVRAPD